MIQEWSKLSLPLVAQNAGLNLPKVSISTIGPLPVKYSAWSAAMLLTSNSFLQPQMKTFTMDAEIRMQINFIRCARGPINLSTAVFFLFHNISQDKSPLVKPDYFFFLKGISKLQCNPYNPASFSIPVVFQSLSHLLFGLSWQFPNWSVLCNTVLF